MVSVLTGAREEWLRTETPVTPEQAAVMHALADSLAAADGGVQAVAQRVATGVAELYGDGAFVTLAAEDGRSYRAVGAHHPDPAAAVAARETMSSDLGMEDGFFAHVAETGAPLYVPDISAADVVRLRPELQHYLEAVGVHCGIVVPLRSRGRVIGTLNLLRGPGRPAIAPGDQSFLEEIADRLAIGIDALRLAAALERLDPAPAPPSAGEDLTPREGEVLGMIGRGHTNREAGEQLHLSVRTVEWYRERLQLKLGTSGRAALVQAARARGLGG
jgi:DNA-binding CsgD family transcriptional regulator